MLESLRETMDDLHYANALHEGRLPPSRPVPKLPDNEIYWYIDNLKTTKPEELELENICSQPLGFYLVGCILCVYCLIALIRIFSCLIIFSLRNFYEKMARRIWPTL